MKTHKNMKLFFIADIIVFILFTAAAFILPFVRKAAFWTGYGFGALSLLTTALVVWYSLSHDGLKSKFYGIPSVLIVLLYVIIQIPLSLVEMALSIIPYKYIVLINLILFAIVLIGLIGAQMGKNAVVSTDERIMNKTYFIKSMQSEINMLIPDSHNPLIQKELRSLSETVRYSDPVSIPQTAELESRMEELLLVLKENLNTDNYDFQKKCREFSQLLSDRNQKIKLSK